MGRGVYYTHWPFCDRTFNLLHSLSNFLEFSSTEGILLACKQILFRKVLMGFDVEQETEECFPTSRRSRTDLAFPCQEMNPKRSMMEASIPDVYFSPIRQAPRVIFQLSFPMKRSSCLCHRKLARMSRYFKQSLPLPLMSVFLIPDSFRR